MNPDDEMPAGYAVDWYVGLALRRKEKVGSGRSLIAEGLRRKEHHKGYEHPFVTDELIEDLRAIEQAARMRTEAALKEKREAEAKAKVEAERIAREKQIEAEAHYEANPVYGSL